MKFAVVLLVAVASVQAVPAGWSSGPGWTTTAAPGWSDPTTQGWSQPTTTQGWSEPTTTQGWSQPPGWNQPSTSGWNAPARPDVSIVLVGDAAAAGSGWAAENHAENVQATGGGWVPAEISIAAGGDSVIDQQGVLVQTTNIDSDTASAVNLASVSQIAEANEGMALAASGLDVLVGQSGWGAASGEGAVANDAITSILATSQNLGLSNNN